MNAPGLVPPVGPDDHVQGHPAAPLTLVEYADYECGFCRDALPVIRELQRRHGADLRIVFRHFPLGLLHAHADVAAEAAEAAADRGLFWPMHDLIRQSPEAPDEAHMLMYGAALGIDRGWMATALRARRYLPRVRAHFDSGVRSGVNGTPCYFINGERHDGGCDELRLHAALQAASSPPVSAPP